MNNRPLTYLSALLMSFLAQLPQFDSLVIQSNTFHGLLLLSSHLTESVLITHISFYLMQIVVSIFFHLKSSQPFGMLFQHLKNFRLLGRRSLFCRIIIYIRMLFIKHFRSWASIIPSLMRKMSMFLLLVSLI